ncbi:5368_t:CDS:1, partial [Cetraspora pellucida]
IPDITEAVIHYNNRPNNENDKFELLDPDSNENNSGEDELLESDNKNEIVKSSELEIESATKRI